MKSFCLLLLILLFLSENLYSSWDSPNFITNQNKRMVNLEGHLGDIGVLFLNGVAIEFIL